VLTCEISVLVISMRCYLSFSEYRLLIRFNYLLLPDTFNDDNRHITYVLCKRLLRHIVMLKSLEPKAKSRRLHHW